MAPKPPKGTNALLMQAAQTSLSLLKDPKVQEQILNGAASFSAALKEKSQARAERPPKGVRVTQQPEVASGASFPARRSTRDTLTSPFGHQKLDRRVVKLRTNVELLKSAVGPEAGAALDEVEAVVSRLDVAVTMAGNLPLAKRRQAYSEIASVLDELERGVFATVME